LQVTHEVVGAGSMSGSRIPNDERLAPAGCSATAAHESGTAAWPRLARWSVLSALILSAIGAAGVGGAAPGDDEPITPIRMQGVDAARVGLGEKLFHDAALSGNGTFACASCHYLDRGGGDGRSQPLGADGRPLDFNAPTLFNVALNYRLNWRGNFRTLEAHNEAVLLDRRLMNTNWDQLLSKLRADPDYVRSFAAIYGDGPTRTQVLDALATFQRSLLTPNARFDRYLDGEREAITPEEERGYQLFKSYGCAACHQGVNVGGNLSQTFGVFFEPIIQEWRRTNADLGRFAFTGAENDRHVFRVPSLRNVAVTAPYFHNGTIASLSEAVDIMARVQLGRHLPSEDLDLIVKFLATLTGEYRGRSLAADAGRSKP
jgi:cytochrome c peroxidase